MELEKMKEDDEAAHNYEDALRKRVLEDIASGAYSAKECAAFAKETLRTKKVKFSRWCA